MRIRYSSLVFGNLAAAVLALAVGGCGGGGPSPEGPTGTVSGKVTFNGTPVTVGQITFNSYKGDIAFSDLGEDGGYALKWRGTTSKIPIGEYQVSIVPPAPPPSGDDMTGPPPAKHPSIPDKYHNSETSGFTFTVKEGENSMDFDMK